MIQACTAVRAGQVKDMPPPNGYSLPGAEPNYSENGREFHGWRKGLYMYPCDEPEKERMDIFHALFLEARGQKLHNAPVNLNKEGCRVLDVGTGTGIWAIDIADQNPNAEVIGLDLVNIQPASIPNNLRFRVPRDFESMWALGENSFDLIHLRMASGGVSSWPELYHKIFAHLKPGVGYVEIVEIDYEPRCDDGEIPSRLRDWNHWMNDATDSGSKPIQFVKDVHRLQLTRAGFTDIKMETIRLPYNTWPSDPREKDIGRWYNVTLTEGLEALSLGPFTRVFRWPPEDVRRLVDELKPLICNRQYHIYNNLHIMTARRA